MISHLIDLESSRRLVRSQVDEGIYLKDPIASDTSLRTQSYSTLTPHVGILSREDCNVELLNNSSNV
jgi:hypothetical protein